jgi:hypothetical protein
VLLIERRTKGEEGTAQDSSRKGCHIHTMGEEEEALCKKDCRTQTDITDSRRRPVTKWGGRSSSNLLRKVEEGMRRGVCLAGSLWKDGRKRWREGYCRLSRRKRSDRSSGIDLSVRAGEGSG